MNKDIKEKNVEEIKKLRYVGIDNWDRPVYKDEDGKLYKDIALDKIGYPIHLCTSVNNDFYGEPDCNVKFDFMIIKSKKVQER